MNHSPLPTPEEVLSQHHLSPKQEAFIQQSRLQIQRIIDRKDPRHLLIIGPCSIHETSAIKEYAIRLKKLAETIADKFFVIMRTYLEKSRTATGWTGFVNDPYCDNSYAIATGLSESRCLLLSFADFGLPCGMEWLTPAVYPYLGDLISWGCIGARTTSSQIHRQH